MTTGNDILKKIKDENIKYVDLRFTDPRGKLQHVTMDAGVIEDDTFEEGVMFDGSSIAGWKAINESDMVLMPDPSAAYIDPFFSAATLAINCDILEPLTYQPYNRDPRTTAKKAEAYVKASGIGDSVYFGPEPEFFIFDDVRYSTSTYNVGFRVDSTELPANTDTIYESGNNGHHIGLKKGYFPVPPLDSAQDMRSEMLAAMGSMGVPIEKHHHEVASAQHELGIRFSPIINAADNVQIYKYVIQQVAQAYGKTATFMPKPIRTDNGSGMHTHISI
ncbi:MAG TPA: glutamine synthetase, partial [Alphaproteobacteria bacterium]|nr:glutamine synthetase [Alphaproteobacteria bacterium]